MSFLNDLWGGISSVLKPIGSVVSQALPAIGGMLGSEFGPIGGQLLGGLGQMGGDALKGLVGGSDYWTQQMNKNLPPQLANSPMAGMPYNAGSYAGGQAQNLFNNKFNIPSPYQNTQFRNIPNQAGKEFGEWGSNMAQRYLGNNPFGKAAGNFMRDMGSAAGNYAGAKIQPYMPSMLNNSTPGNFLQKAGNYAGSRMQSAVQPYMPQDRNIRNSTLGNLPGNLIDKGVNAATNYAQNALNLQQPPEMMGLAGMDIDPSGSNYSPSTTPNAPPEMMGLAGMGYAHGGHVPGLREIYHALNNYYPSYVRGYSGAY